MGSEKIDWAINGELALNCNCTVFCPCAVSLGDHPPTEGYCQTWLAVRIDNGHFRGKCKCNSVRIPLMRESKPLMKYF